MKNLSLTLLGLLLVAFSHLANARTYLIEAADGGHDTPSEIVANIAFIETMPFDGIAIDDFAGRNLFSPIDAYRDMNPVWTYQLCLDKLSPLTATTFTKFKHNFAKVRMSNGDAPPNLFDDVAWANQLISCTNYAQALLSKNINGIWLDNELYNSVGGIPRVYWSYPEDFGAPLRSISACRAQARLRGQQVMAAFAQGNPNITVIVLHGPYESEVLTPKPRLINYTRATDMSGPFTVGLIEASTATAKGIDGGELYDYNSQPIYEESYEWRRYGMASAATDCMFISPASRVTWPQKCGISYGVFDLERTAPRADTYQVITDLTKARNQLAYALRTADRYVWHYSEAHDWWRPPGTSGTVAGVTQDWIDMVKGAREDAENLLINPDFERELDSWQGNGNRTVVQRADEGQSVMKLDDGPAAAGTSREQVILPNTNYTFTTVGRSGTAGDISGKIGCEQLDAAGTVITNTDQFMTFPDLVSPTQTLLIKTSLQAAKLRLYIRKSAGGGAFYADDLRLIQLGPDLVTNGGFEQGNLGWPLFGATNAVQNSSLAASGSWSMNLAAGFNGDPSHDPFFGASQNLPTEVGATYTATALGRNDEVGDDSGVLLFQFTNAAGGPVDGVTEVSTFRKTSYTRRIIQATAPAAAVGMRVLVFKNPSTANFYADEVQVFKNVPLSFPNAGFEQGAQFWTDEGGSQVVRPGVASRSRAIKLDPAASLFQDVLLEPNQNYQLRGVARGVGTATGRMSLVSLDNNGIPLPASAQFVDFLTNANTARSLVFQTGNQAVTVRVSLEHLSGVGSVMTDDLRLHSITSNVGSSVLEQWRYGHFQTISNTGNAADTADVDADGLSNFAEYALGLDPTISDANRAPTATVNPATREIQMSYTRTRGDVSYALETSADLATWTTAGVNQGSAAIGSSVTASVPASGDPRRFVRLRMRQSP